MFISLAGLVKYTEPRSNTDSCCSAGELAHKGAMLPFFFLRNFILLTVDLRAIFCSCFNTRLWQVYFSRAYTEAMWVRSPIEYRCCRLLSVQSTRRVDGRFKPNHEMTPSDLVQTVFVFIFFFFLCSSSHLLSSSHLFFLLR